MTNLKSYKVEVREVQTYVFDVQAENEEEAKIKTVDLFTQQAESGMLQYHLTGDTEIMEDYTVFDVTGTDDEPQRAEGSEFCGGENLLSDNECNQCHKVLPDNND
jgi:hypothetical protein